MTEKSGGSVPSQVVDSVKKLVDPPLEALGEWGSDIVAAGHQRWKGQNLRATFDRAEEIRSRRDGADAVRPIPPREAAVLIPAVASEDDPTIQELWARLIANATDQNGNHHMRRAYITILTSIDPPEARVLEELRKSMHRSEGAARPPLSAAVDDLVKATELPADTVEDALYHLAGLGCFRMTGTATSLVIDKGSATADQWPTVRGADAHFTMTRLAHSLLQACSP